MKRRRQCAGWTRSRIDAVAYYGDQRLFKQPAGLIFGLLSSLSIRLALGIQPYLL
jgi:hypothetical protein